MRIQTPYDKDYDGCAETHARLRIMDADLNPDEISCILEIEPTAVHHKEIPSALSGWFLETNGIIESKDARHHIDWIIDKVSGKDEAFRKLHECGYLIDLCVVWFSECGHGGPIINSAHMFELSKLDIELQFDIYVKNIKFNDSGVEQIDRTNDHTCPGQC